MGLVDECSGAVTGDGRIEIRLHKMQQLLTLLRLCPPEKNSQPSLVKMARARSGIHFAQSLDSVASWNSRASSAPHPRLLRGAPPPALLLCGYRNATELIECERVQSG
jgi:hypothetical protein